MAADFEIDWIDRRRNPRSPPDPRYPEGMDICIAAGDGPTCSTLLGYPARRCGYYVVRCLRCGLTVTCTTAGRPDDPRSLTVNCLTRIH